MWPLYIYICDQRKERFSCLWHGGKKATGQSKKPVSSEVGCTKDSQPPM